MRKLSVVLIALGAFLIVLAPMARWYAYPRVAVAPAAQKSVTTLVGPDATIFDIATLSEIQTDLVTKVRTVGDTRAAEKTDGAVVYVNSTSTTSSDGVLRGGDVERMTFDARTAEAIPNSGDFISETEGVETPIEHEGLLAKFPFQTEKKTYEFWDGSLKKAVPIEYLGEEKVEGLTTYKFEHSVEATQIGTREIPLSLLGETGEGNVEAPEMYSVVRTLWVEPETGAVIKRTEQVRNTINWESEPRITLTDVTTSYDDATVKKNADDYGSKASLLNLLYSVVPLVSLLVGLFLLFAGLTLARRRVHTDDDARRELAEARA